MKPTNKWPGYTRRITCGRCGRVGHRQPHCRAPAMKAHDRLGVEIEGWWLDGEPMAEIRRKAAAHGGSIVRDGSLVADATGETVAWEIRSAPSPLGQILAAVHDLYPHKTDPSAGMHLHMSFVDDHDATILCDPAFLEYALARWHAWGTREEIHAGSNFWSRLRGDNRFCLRHEPHEWGVGRNVFRGGERYRWLNFTSWERHRTVELRLLPLFRDERLAHSALCEWIDIVEGYLAGWRHDAVAIPVLLPSDEPEVIADEVTLPEAERAEIVASDVALYAVPPTRDGVALTTAATAARTLRAALRAP